MVKLAFMTGIIYSTLCNKGEIWGPIPETMTLDVACDIPCEMKIANPEFISHATLAVACDNYRMVCLEWFDPVET